VWLSDVCCFVHMPVVVLHYITCCCRASIHWTVSSFWSIYVYGYWKLQFIWRFVETRCLSFVCSLTDFRYSYYTVSQKKQTLNSCPWLVSSLFWTFVSFIVVFLFISSLIAAWTFYVLKYVYVLFCAVFTCMRNKRIIILLQMLTDFQNSFADRLSGKFQRHYSTF